MGESHTRPPETWLWPQTRGGKDKRLVPRGLSKDALLYDCGSEPTALPSWYCEAGARVSLGAHRASLPHTSPSLVPPCLTSLSLESFGAGAGSHFSLYPGPEKAWVHCSDHLCVCETVPHSHL